ncbi:MAG: hypothetical protein JSU70_14935 [Phycisphaerales bacterium]|nr:MAG: hypothetical protein JSU70_14935 [Phycisphaerales bacterium]
MNPASIDRRQFLQAGLIATTLAAAGRLPLLGAGTRGRSGIDASTKPYAIKPIRGYLQRFSPSDSDRALRKKSDYGLTYDIIHWGGANQRTGISTNSVIGQISINRKAARGTVLYDVTQRTRIGGVENCIKAQITTDNGNSLRKWTFRSYHVGSNGVTDPLSKITETGDVKNGYIEINNGKCRYGYAATQPLMTQWTLPNLLMWEGSPKLNVTFDLLQDLSLFKANQVLRYDGEIQLNARGGQALTLQTYAQVGEGILPIHYLCDSEGYPQLITSSILSWALAASKQDA